MVWLFDSMRSDESGKNATKKCSLNEMHRLILYFVYHTVSDGKPAVSSNNQAPKKTPRSAATTPAEQHNDRATHNGTRHRPPASDAPNPPVIDSEEASAKHAESKSEKSAEDSSTQGTSAENEVGNEQRVVEAEVRRVPEGGEHATAETDEPPHPPQPVPQQQTADHTHPQSAGEHHHTPHHTHTQDPNEASPTHPTISHTPYPAPPATAIPTQPIPSSETSSAASPAMTDPCHAGGAQAVHILRETSKPASDVQNSHTPPVEELRSNSALVSVPDQEALSSLAVPEQDSTAPPGQQHPSEQPHSDTGPHARGAVGQHEHAKREKTELAHPPQQETYTEAQQTPDQAHAKTGDAETQHHATEQRRAHRTHPQPEKTGQVHRKPDTPAHPHAKAEDKQKHKHEKEHHRPPSGASTDIASHRSDGLNSKQHTMHTQTQAHQRHSQQHEGPAHHKYPYAGSQHAAAPPPAPELPTPANKALPDLVSVVCY